MALGVLSILAAMLLGCTLRAARQQALISAMDQLGAGYEVEHGLAHLATAPPGAPRDEARARLVRSVGALRRGAEPPETFAELDAIERGVEAWSQTEPGSVEESAARGAIHADLQALLAGARARLGERQQSYERASLSSHLGVTLVSLAVVLLFAVLGGLYLRRVRGLDARARESSAVVAFQRERFEGLLRKLPVPVVRTLGPEHRIDFTNEPLRALWGEQSVADQRLCELRPELCAVWDRAFSGGAQAGSPVTWTIERDGRLDPVHLNLWVEPLRGQQGAIEGVVGVAIDVTGLVEARAHAERLQALSASLSRSLTLREVAEVIVEGSLAALEGQAGFLAILDDDGAAFEIKALRGQLPPAIGPEALLPVEAATPVNEVLRSGELVVIGSPEEFSARYPALAATVPASMPVRASAHIPLSLDGRLVGVLGLSYHHPRSFTEADRSLMLTAGRLCAQAFERASLYDAEKSAHTDAEQAIEVRDEFLSVASHELKTPLTVVQLQLQRAIRFGHEPDAMRALSALNAAERSAGKLGRLIDNLLDVSQMRANRMLLELERVDLADALGDVAERFRDELARSGSVLKVQADGGIVGLWDRLRVEQIASNLLSNAIKFGAGRPILLEAIRAGAAARITVRDGGLGIPPEDQKRIFKRFERAVSARHFGGLGLGLWITRLSVEALGGTIEVQSEPGISSTFVVTLPCGGPGATLGPPQLLS